MECHPHAHKHSLTNCRWEKHTIVVMDIVSLSEPYGTDNVCHGNKPSQQDRHTRTPTQKQLQISDPQRESVAQATLNQVKKIVCLSHVHTHTHTHIPTAGEQEEVRRKKKKYPTSESISLPSAVCASNNTARTKKTQQQKKTNKKNKPYSPLLERTEIYIKKPPNKTEPPPPLPRTLVPSPAHARR